MASSTLAEKLELLNAETNKIYTVYVSAEDAHKARNDKGILHYILYI